MVRESEFSVQGIGVGVIQELAWVSQVAIDEIPRVKEVQGRWGYKSHMWKPLYKRLLSPDPLL